ncbi:hypothetical protein [Actinomadura sp. DC4]|uniref:hypothetical protein n=1 Tax=Actinomadura sp. DC4 TaxID=3055069 RepID=UPI0025AFD735|nr:hypothetical protein [Actinomadura sp. DC4]MDN3352197.1 hypothetical protein [Actinomadura sp. DC4]
MSFEPVSPGVAEAMDGPGGRPEPPSRGRRRRVLAVACGLAGITLVVTVVRLTGGDPEKAYGRAAREAGGALTKAPALSLDGTYGGGPATFTVGGAGTARGSYAAGGEQVSRVDIDATTYLRAGTNFWKAHGESPAIADEAGGRWAKAPDGYAELGLSSLSPEHLGQNLLDPGTVLAPARTSLNGVGAIRLTAAGLTYFVSAKAPHRVLRVQGRTVSNTFSFDLAPLRETTAFFAALRKDVRGPPGRLQPQRHLRADRRETPVQRVRSGGVHGQRQGAAGRVGRFGSDPRRHDRGLPRGLRPRRLPVYGLGHGHVQAPGRVLLPDGRERVDVLVPLTRRALPDPGDADVRRHGELRARRLPPAPPPGPGGGADELTRRGGRSPARQVEVRPRCWTSRA